MSPFLKAIAQTSSNSCDDPWKDQGWFKVYGNEIYDFRNLLVWHRCPALYTENGKCVSSNTLPSENLNSAQKIPQWAPKGNWRIPSILELSPIVAKNCDHQFPDALIELPPVPLWSSTTEGGLFFKINEEGKVYIEKEVNIAWTIYVRDFEAADIIRNKTLVVQYLDKLSDIDILRLSKKTQAKLIGVDLILKNGLRRSQKGVECYLNIENRIFSSSCKNTDGSYFASKSRYDCLGKKDNLAVCLSQNISDDPAMLSRAAVRADFQITDNNMVQKVYPNFSLDNFAPIRVESTYDIPR